MKSADVFSFSPIAHLYAFLSPDEQCARQVKICLTLRFKLYLGGPIRAASLSLFAQEFDRPIALSCFRAAF
jgi:hypothetical protein